MTGTYEYREKRFEDEDDPGDAAQWIIEKMCIDLPADSLEGLLRETRHVHRMVLSEWRRRNDPEWRPPRPAVRWSRH